MSEKIKVFAMRHGEPDPDMPKYLNPGLTDKAREDVRGTIMDKVLGTLVNVIDIQAEASRREEAEGVAIKKVSDMFDKAKTERSHAIWQEVREEHEAHRDAQLQQLATNGTKLAVVSSRVQRAKDTAQVAADTLNDYGMLHPLAGQDIAESHMLVQFSETFPRFKDGITARDIVNATVATIYPPLKPEDLEPVGGLVMVMHEPLLYSMSPYVLAGRYIDTPIAHGEVLTFDIPKDSLTVNQPGQ
jgi:hypothetical protein